MDKILAFDIETAHPAPDDPGASFRVGITCAATATSDGDARVWHGGEQRDGRLAGRMTAGECSGLAAELCAMNDAGYTVVGVNSLGFDLRVLAAESQDLATQVNLQELALDHVDICFQMLCERGFMVGLAALAAGAGISGKLSGMDGLKAVAAWQGTRGDQDRVLRYVAQDARATLIVCETIAKRCEIRWRNSKGQVKSHRIERLLTVREALALPEPDTSWMDEPWPRSRFAGWVTNDAV